MTREAQPTLGEMTLEEFLQRLHSLFAADDCDIVIESGIPFPTTTDRLGGSKYPWDQLAVGDSFLSPTLSISCSNANKRYAPKHFISKTVQKSGTKFLRIWRDR